MSIQITTLKIRHYGDEDDVLVWMGWVPEDELVPTILRYFRRLHSKNHGALAQLDKYDELYGYCSEEQIGCFDYSHTYALTRENMEVSPTFGDPSDPVI